MKANRKASQEFHFGLETEFIVIDKKTSKALWHNDLNFSDLNTILESIVIDEVLSLDGLDLEPPHQKLMPYVVEGYHVPDENFNMVNILPKGLEIRTPVSGSIDACMASFKTLYLELKKALEYKNYDIAALSHHPIYSHFEGKQNKRRHDYWLWAMEVMTTYGPDINISFPKDFDSQLDYKDLDAKINYYGPAMAALSVASPFVNGQIWKLANGEFGKSFRTFRRSVIAPAVEYHPDENGRIEFKLFEMSPRAIDYKNYFLLFLALVLDSNLKGRSSQQSRIYDLGSVAQFGLASADIKKRAGELLERAPQILDQWGFDSKGLATFHRRFDTHWTPADELVEIFSRNSDIKEVLQFLCQMDFDLTLV